MKASISRLCFLLVVLLPLTAYSQQHKQPVCFAVDEFFRDEVWAKVGQRVCLNCHHVEGDASDSRFLLIDPTRQQVSARERALTANHGAFRKMVLAGVNGKSRMLQKVTGGLDHGGGEVLELSSTEYRILSTFAEREKRLAEGSPKSRPAHRQADEKPFFDGIVMLHPQRLLRRVTLSLVGRLPTSEEIRAVEQHGSSAMNEILNGVLAEPAFFDRLEEGFNDIFLMVGYNGVPERVLGYRNFGKTRHWNQKVTFEEIEDEKERRQAGYKLADDYRQAVLKEPYALIRHIVRNELPFTQIVTADYIMVSPYTARGYGIFDQVKDSFQDPEDHLEFIPARLPALRRNDGKPDQESPTGLYPHAGLLTTFHWLKRYPTTETNRNRLRSRMYFQHFLGVDIMALAPRVTDAAAVNAEYEIPTMQAADCVVCHRTVDPIAGLFQDYYDTSASMDPGPYSPRKEGWFTDMFPPGAEGLDLPEEERWRGLQWLGERTAKDPRFAVAMVEHVYYILTGRPVLLPPQDIDDPMFNARRRAYQVQRNETERIAQEFTDSNFNLKHVFKAWITSQFYQADGLASAVRDPDRQAELDDIGILRLLSPEQLDRKIQAVFGWRWDRFNKDLRTLYGGIDSKEITQRLTDPSGAVGAVQRIMANEVACRNVAKDFSLPVEKRRLFSGVEPDVIPLSSGPADSQIRQAIVHLHRLILGQIDSPDSDSVSRTFDLFASVVRDAQLQSNVSPTESYFCKSSEGEGKRDPDPHYTIRAWRAVVTYLLRQEGFLYE